MKKYILAAFYIILIIAMLSGCSGKSSPETAAADSQKAAEAKAAEDTQKAVDNAMEVMETLTNKEWPTDKLPSELPEYTEGEIVNSGGEADEFYIKIDKTSKEALTDYLEKLKDLGWSVEDGKQAEAEKGIYSIDFSWQGEDHLQMAVYTGETGAWPKDQMPPDVIPPSDCTFIGEISLMETIEGQVWYTNYQCDGINEEEAKAYMDMLVQNGWAGDVSMVTKTFEWKGKKYEGSIELYETDENSSTFTLNLSLVQ